MTTESETGWRCPGTARSRLETYTAAATPAHSNCGLVCCGYLFWDTASYPFCLGMQRCGCQCHPGTTSLPRRREGLRSDRECFQHCCLCATTAQLHSLKITTGFVLTSFSVLPEPLVYPQTGCTDFFLHSQHWLRNTKHDRTPHIQEKRPCAGCDHLADGKDQS